MVDAHASQVSRANIFGQLVLALKNDAERKENYPKITKGVLDPVFLKAGNAALNYF